MPMAELTTEEALRKRLLLENIDRIVAKARAFGEATACDVQA